MKIQSAILILFATFYMIACTKSSGGGGLNPVEENVDLSENPEVIQYTPESKEYTYLEFEKAREELNKDLPVPKEMGQTGMAIDIRLVPGMSYLKKVTGTSPLTHASIQEEIVREVGEKHITKDMYGQISNNMTQGCGSYSGRLVTFKIFVNDQNQVDHEEKLDDGLNPLKSCVQQKTGVDPTKGSSVTCSTKPDPEVKPGEGYKSKYRVGRVVLRNKLEFQVLERESDDNVIETCDGQPERKVRILTREVSSPQIPGDYFRAAKNSTEGYTVFRVRSKFERPSGKLITFEKSELLEFKKP